MQNQRWRKTIAATIIAAFSMPVSLSAEAEFDHGVFDELLAAHIVEGGVDYASLAPERERLQGYIEALGAVAPETVAAWPQTAQLAFWINAYNAQMIDIVLEHRPLKRRGLRSLVYPSNSVRQIPNIWKGQTRVIAQVERSLDDIEHGIIRPEFAEPRIHFALVCAAESCPPLRAEAYVGDRLDAQLQAQTKTFLADSARGARIDEEQNRLAVSSIFKWFAEDFGGVEGVAAFVAAHGPPELGARTGATPLGYLSYDWTLNDRTRNSQ